MFPKPALVILVLFSVALSLTPTSVRGSASFADTPTFYEPRDVWETWLTKVPVGGRIRVGIMNLAVDKNARPPNAEQFVVYLPSPTPRTLCVTVTSRDGRYNARLTYELSHTASGLAVFHLPTKHKASLAGYRARELALLAELKPHCDAPSEKFVVATWEHQRVGTTIHVFLNSSVDSTYLVLSKDGSSKVFPCAELDDADAVAYNRVCELPSDGLRGLADLTIKRRRNSIFMTDVSLSTYVR